jgi:hypothetical protein
VFYEVGYAEGLTKKIILISQDQDIPFDLRTQRQILYQVDDIHALELRLKELLAGVFGVSAIKAPARSA